MRPRRLRRGNQEYAGDPEVIGRASMRPRRLRRGNVENLLDPADTPPGFNEAAATSPRKHPLVFQRYIASVRLQ